MSKRWVSLGGAVAWLIAPVAWGVATVLDRTRPWEGTPRTVWMLGWVALMAGSVAMLVRAVAAIAPYRRHGSARVGLGLMIVGVIAAVVIGWAVIAWTTLLGLGVLLAATGMNRAAPAQTIGWAMLAATVIQVGLTVLEVGTPDDYGDYPIAWTTATWVAALGAGGGMLMWSRADAEAETLEPLARS